MTDNLKVNASKAADDANVAAHAAYDDTSVVVHNALRGAGVEAQMYQMMQKWVSTKLFLTQKLRYTRQDQIWRKSRG